MQDPAGDPSDPPPAGAPPGGWPPQGYPLGGQGGAAAPGPATAPAPHPAPHRPAAGPTNVFAILSLITSILGLVGVLALIGSILGIVFAIVARNEIARNPQQEGRELAQWGMILGVIGLVIWALIVLIMLLFMLFFGGMFWWWADHWEQMVSAVSWLPGPL